MTKTIGISDHWYTVLGRVVASGIRRSRPEIVHEALARHWPRLEREMEAEIEVRNEVKERMKNEH